MTFNPWRRRERLDHTELTRLLPAPGDPVLPYDRQLLLEDYLMNEIRQATPEPSEGVAQQSGRDKRSRRKRLALRLGLPVAILVASAGTVAAVVIHDDPAPSADSTTVACAAELQRRPDDLAVFGIEDGKTPEETCRAHWGEMARDMQQDAKETNRRVPAAFRSVTAPAHLVGCTSPKGDEAVVVYPRPKGMTDVETCRSIGLVRPDEGPVHDGATSAQIRKLQHLIDDRLGAEGRNGSGDGCDSYTATRAAVRAGLDQLGMHRWRIDDRRTGHSDTADVWYSIDESSGTVVLRSGDDAGHCTAG